jgi:hypothetical protein
MRVDLLMVLGLVTFVAIGCAADPRRDFQGFAARCAPGQPDGYFTFCEMVRKPWSAPL